MAVCLLSADQTAYSTVADARTGTMCIRVGRRIKNRLLFDVESNTITYHLGEIYKSGELEQI